MLVKINFPNSNNRMYWILIKRGDLRIKKSWDESCDYKTNYKENN